MLGLFKGFPVPWISLRDHRKIIPKSALLQKFETDAQASLLIEDGFKVISDGSMDRSRIVYRNDVSNRFTFFADFHPIRKRSEGAYWRAGLSVRRKTGTLQENEVICIHLDNQNLVVGYLNRVVALSAAVPIQINERWSRLEISTSIQGSSPPHAIRVFAHSDDFSYILGEIPVEFPLKVSIEIWSDEHRSHHVLVKDISFTTAHP
jgi:hypothetical protein